MARSCTLKGAPLPLEGPELKVGDPAPEVALKKDLVNQVNLSELRGKPRIYSVVPSLDTPVCSLQTKRFNEEAAKLDKVTTYTISCDLPPAQNRFCGAENINREKMVMLSDHRDGAFGRAYGTYIPSLGIECRAVFVVDDKDRIRYAEYVPEIASHPNYDKALEVARGL